MLHPVVVFFLACVFIFAIQDLVLLRGPVCVISNPRILWMTVAVKHQRPVRLCMLPRLLDDLLHTSPSCAMIHLLFGHDHPLLEIACGKQEVGEIDVSEWLQSMILIQA